MRFLLPRPALTEQEVTAGLRTMTWEGMASMGFTSITTSGFLAAYALALGADNFEIGILAALPFLMQLLQIPAIFLVEKVRRRKLISVISWFLAQLIWFPVALIPVFISAPAAGAVSALLGLIAIRGIINAVTNCSWNSWVRDLIPQGILGRFYSRRLALSTAMAAAFGLIAAFFVDYWPQLAGPENTIYGYTCVLLFGALFLGMLSPILMARMPEPAMPPVAENRPSMWQNLVLPLRDKNFRKLMQFSLLWNFALNLAVPFFSVYMLVRLEIDLVIVISLSVLSQAANILFLKVWGPLADRFGSKVILSLCVSLYILVILGWTFTTMPEKYMLTMPLLITLHFFAGIAAAGVSLTVTTLGMKLAPQGQSTPYMAGASLSTNLGAGLGPLVGGFLGKFFADRVFTMDLSWISPSRAIRLGFIDISGLDFLFIIAFVIGLITLNILAAVREEGEVERETVLGELMSQARTYSHEAGLGPLIGLANMFPLTFLKKLPGFDVAIGVTAYQLAETAQRITYEAARSIDFSNRVTRALERGLTRMFKAIADMPSGNTKDMAEHAARGAMRAAVESEKDTVSLIRPTVTGIIYSLARTKADPEETIHGVTWGIIRIAAESGVDLSVVVKETVESVQDAARKFGLDEKEAALEAAHAALDAVNEVDAGQGEHVREVLARDLFPRLFQPEISTHSRKPTQTSETPADDSTNPAINP